VELQTHGMEAGTHDKLKPRKHADDGEQVGIMSLGHCSTRLTEISLVRLIMHTIAQRFSSANINRGRRTCVKY
jgi:hypothetical protein